MSEPFKDHFSAQAADYARFRPTYPAALFDWLRARAPGGGLAWDAATGSGQAAVALASRFDRVIATDPSEAQLRGAERLANIEYRVERAEASSLADQSADLITIAQALHWLDHPTFFAECQRVLRPGGLFAAWCYGSFTTDPEIEAITGHFYRDVVGPYWPPERAWIERGYAGIALPLSPVEAPAFSLQVRWDLDELVGYLGTWSAVARYREARGEDPLPAVRERLAEVWGPPQGARLVTWPMATLVGRRT